MISEERIGDFVKYTCKLTDSYIILKICGNTINYVESVLDWDNLKIVLNFLKLSFIELKKFKAEKYRYSVHNNEIEYIDIKRWDIISKSNDFYVLECNIDDVFCNVVEGFIS